MVKKKNILQRSQIRVLLAQVACMIDFPGSGRGAGGGGGRGGPQGKFVQSCASEAKSFISLPSLRPYFTTQNYFVQHTELSIFFNTYIKELDFLKEIVGSTHVARSSPTFTLFLRFRVRKNTLFNTLRVKLYALLKN